MCVSLVIMYSLFAQLNMFRDWQFRHVKNGIAAHEYAAQEKLIDGNLCEIAGRENKQ